ncbi:hypothetical protein [Streptomyces hokutonensis]|uniref:Uncharacterized protein n=1 Tax=Streptomyces hokutonensis TaxID=1306990 RepID=A0ABW6M5J2_9ACTN
MPRGSALFGFLLVNALLIAGRCSASGDGPGASALDQVAPGLRLARTVVR